MSKLQTTVMTCTVTSSTDSSTRPVKTLDCRRHQSVEGVHVTSAPDASDVSPGSTQQAGDRKETTDKKQFSSPMSLPNHPPSHTHTPCLGWTDMASAPPGDHEDAGRQGAHLSLHEVISSSGIQLAV